MMEPNEMITMAKDIMELIKKTRGRGNTSFLVDSIDSFSDTEGKVNTPVLIGTGLLCNQLKGITNVNTVKSALQLISGDEFVVFDNDVIYQICRMVCDRIACKSDDDTSGKEPDICISRGLTTITIRN